METSRMVFVQHIHSFFQSLAHSTDIWDPALCWACTGCKNDPCLKPWILTSRQMEKAVWQMLDWGATEAPRVGPDPGLLQEVTLHQRSAKKESMKLPSSTNTKNHIHMSWRSWQAKNTPCEIHLQSLKNPAFRLLENTLLFWALMKPIVKETSKQTSVQQWGVGPLSCEGWLETHLTLLGSPTLSEPQTPLILPLLSLREFPQPTDSGISRSLSEPLVCPLAERGSWMTAPPAIPAAHLVAVSSTHLAGKIFFVCPLLPPQGCLFHHT